MITQFFTTFTGGFILPIAVLAIIVMAQVLQTTKSMDVCNIHYYMRMGLLLFWLS